MAEKKRQIDWQGQALPIRIGKPEPGQGVRVSRNELEAPGGYRLEPQGACVAGAKNVPSRHFKQMAVFGGQCGATKLAPFPPLLNDTRAREAPERREGRDAAP